MSRTWLAPLCLLVLSSLTACASRPIAEHVHQPTAVGWNGLSIPLFAPIADVDTAGQPAAGDWTLLAAHGIQTVVDLRAPQELVGRDEAAEVAAAGLEYRRLPIAGAGDLTLENADALAAILKASDGPVLVHCASANRAGGLLALMARQQGMAPEQALALGRKAGMRSTEQRVRQVMGLPPAAAAN